MPTRLLSLRRHAQLLLAIALTALIATWLLASDALAAGTTPGTTPKATGEDTPLNLPTDAGSAAGDTGGGGLVRTIVGLFVVIAVIYGVTWLLKQAKASREGDAHGTGLQSSASLPLGGTRALHLVRAGNEWILLGVTDGGVTPVRTYTEAEARARRTPRRSRGCGRPASRARPRLQRARHDVLRRTPPRPHGAPMSPVIAQTSLQDGGQAVQLLILIASLSIVPALLFTVTGFTRILIVLGFIRTGLGTPTAPPNQVLVGIALFLTLFVMGPTFTKVNDDAVQPFLANKISVQTAFERGQGPMREFMFRQTRDRDLALFVKMGKLERPRTRADVPTRVLIPAFILSELKTAFEIGFMIFLPFLVIDLVVSATLMSLGMIMLPPSFISLPFKLLLFVLVDGWSLITQSLVQSFN